MAKGFQRNIGHLFYNPLPKSIQTWEIDARRFVNPTPQVSPEPKVAYGLWCQVWASRGHSIGPRFPIHLLWSFSSQMARVFAAKWHPAEISTVFQYRSTSCSAMARIDVGLDIVSFSSIICAKFSLSSSKVVVRVLPFLFRLATETGSRNLCFQYFTLIETGGEVGLLGTTFRIRVRRLFSSQLYVTA